MQDCVNWKKQKKTKQSSIQRSAASNKIQPAWSEFQNIFMSDFQDFKSGCLRLADRWNISFPSGEEPIESIWEGGGGGQDLQGDSKNSLSQQTQKRNLAKHNMFNNSSSRVGCTVKQMQQVTALIKFAWVSC